MKRFHVKIESIHNTEEEFCYSVHAISFLHVYKKYSMRNVLGGGFFPQQLINFVYSILR